MSKDYYDVLGVSKSSTKEEIKKAYKNLAKKYHPDINNEDGAEQKFKDLNEAASVLGDDAKRQQYDQFGDAEAFKRAGGQGFGGFDSGGFGDFASFDFGDIFDQFFSGGGFRSRSRARNGADIRADIEISLEEASSGVEKILTLPRIEQCHSCDGSGAATPSDLKECSECGGAGTSRRTQRTPFGVFTTTSTCRTCKGKGKSITKECKTCDGTGLIRKQRKIEIKIPAGAEEGTNLRLTGQGEAGESGAVSGDLYIVIHIKEHDTFERHGDDLYLKISVLFVTAALGGEIDVDTLGGKAKLKIPSGTQSNTVFRMRGKGIPHLHGSGKGDQHVEVVIEVPEKLSKKQKDLLKEFGKIGMKKGLFS
ncbi:molecular chaperone DnaJ [Candidatus Woesearchaeota archaeon]|nr:molecular chaperone DnaJ [Candidatus Woesearchaeota archaeon]